MRLLLITPSFNVGGIERNMQLLTSAFIDKGCEVDLLVLYGGKVYTQYDDRAKIFVPKMKRGNNKISQILYRLRLPLYIRKIANKTKPDIVLSMADTFNGLVVLSCMGLKLKVFIGDVTKPDLNFALSTKIMKRLFYPYASGFIAQTKSAANFYQEKFGSRFNIEVIGPILNEVELKPIVKEQIILNVGRLHYAKGQDRMVEILALIKNIGDWKLYLTADGPLRKTIEDTINEFDLKNSVKLLGYVDDLNELYNKASIFVMPSRYEGYPNALIEAMSAKLPCVVFDSFPAEEIIDDKVNGFIIEDGDYESFADTLQSLIEDGDLRNNIGRAARESVLGYTKEAITDKMLGFFNRAELSRK
jgi:GalNAc-alpha-(1->4)-GalNAc-alpha-(1->3)-diNAcBac-PP-undecaprenol alpha-1,4-N-acetyl-D-galactosaminyltransferase